MNQVSAAGFLVAEHLVKTYGAGATTVYALNGVTLEAEAGSLTVVTGRSGSGKTTLLNCLTGLDRPDAGQVWLGGTEITALADEQLRDLRRDHIGFVFQTFALLPQLTAAENVGLPLRLRRAPVVAREAQVSELLELVGLAGRGTQLPGQLSGGEQQRVAIARALVTDPDLLVADEPTGQLDSGTGRMIIDLLIGVTRERGTTSLIATHDEALIDRADQHLCLLDGAISRATAARDSGAISPGPRPIKLHPHGQAAARVRG